MSDSPWPMDLSQARILLSNDDGIHAPGLKVLEKIARQLSRDIWVVAPEAEQSGTGHSLTLRRPLRLRQMSRRRYACDGTPTDSVLLALNHLLKDRRPALLLSGVNRGGNLGEDISYSGTVAAAMEATLLGVPSIALSLALPWGEHPHWATAEHFAPDLIRKLVAKGWPRNVLINVNFPHRSADRVQGARLARQGRRKIGDSLVQGKDPRGVPYWWIGDSRTEDRRVAGSDLDTVQDGFISVTPIHLDMTHGPTMSALRQAIE